MWVSSRGRDENHIHSLYAHRCSHNRRRNLRSSFFLFVFDKRQRKTVVWGLGRQGAMQHWEELGIPMFISPGRKIKFIDKSIDFHSQEHRLGHLALDESSASDFYIRKELGLDPGWGLKDLTIDFSALLIPWRAMRELYVVSGSCQGPRPLWCC